MFGYTHLLIAFGLVVSVQLNLVINLVLFNFITCELTPLFLEDCAFSVYYSTSSTALLLLSW